MAKYSSLRHKNIYVMYSSTNPSSHENYEFENLISVKNLERYLGHLLILGPLLEVDKNVWQMSYQEIINTYIANSNTDSNQNTRSHYFLNNALKMVQSSIAQEALLAGEPILLTLNDKYLEDIFLRQIALLFSEWMFRTQMYHFSVPLEPTSFS